MKHDVVNVAQLHEFDEIVDVRSPSEYELDHIPGAINCPVLFDDERARVGTIHARESSFTAKKIGAALVARNIARHIEDAFADKPKRWRPLIYCWRGGQRSQSMASVLRQTGWDAKRLDGGYKAFRRHVLADIDRMIGELSFRVVCGFTGSGKSALLRELEKLGAQVLDLEAIAEHRGSVLGQLPGGAQPGQKMFESRIWNKLGGFEPSRWVYVEAESRKIGDLRLSESLMKAMRASPCVFLQASEAARVSLLLSEYRHFTFDPAELLSRLNALTWLHGRKQIARWTALVSGGEWEPLVQELLRSHYDPAYRKSTMSNYFQLPQAIHLAVSEGTVEEFAALASNLIADETGADASPPSLDCVA